MGINYDGGMIVGAAADELTVPDNFVDDDGCRLPLYEWAEEIGLECMSMWYDAGYEGKVYGFRIKSYWYERELDELVTLVRQKMKEFKELTGVDAKLIGMQDIW